MIGIGSGLYSCKLLAEGDFEAGQQSERMNMVNTKRMYSLTSTCGEPELVFKCAQLLHSEQDESRRMLCAGRQEKFETAKVESLFLF